MKTRHVPSLILTVLLLVGCDGDAEEVLTGPSVTDTETGGGSPSGDEPGSGQTPSSGGVNGNLTGRLFTTINFQPYEFDLATGAGRELPIQTNKEYLVSVGRGDLAGESNYFVPGDSASPRFVETTYDCFSAPTGACLSVYDNEFRTTRRMALYDSTLTEPAKISHSGRYVVTSDLDPWSNEVAYITIRDVTINTANVAETLVSRLEVNNERSGRGELPGHPVVEWGPNDEVYFTVPSDQRPTVYITEPRSLTVARTIRLPSSYQGVIEHLDIHPDGGRLLLGYRGRTGSVDTNGIVINLDLDSLSIRIPAVNRADVQTKPIGGNFVSQFSNPMWSPDGAHIMFLNNKYRGGAAVSSSVANVNQLVVLPASASREIVNQSFESTPSPAIIIRLNDVVSSGQLNARWRGDTVKQGHIDWVR